MQGPGYGVVRQVHQGPYWGGGEGPPGDHPNPGIENQESPPLQADSLPLSHWGKESAYNVGDLGLIPELGRSQRKALQPTPVFLPGETPWTEEPGRLLSMGSQKVGHN